MPSYNNILSSGKNESGAGESNASKSSPSASMKLLQDHLLAKRRAQQKQQQHQQQQRLAMKSKKSANRSNVGVTDSLHQLQATQENNPDEEYDPMVPNSYEVVKAEYIKSEKRRLSNISNSATKKLSVPHLLNVLDELDDIENDDVKKPDRGDKKNRGTAIAPPPSLNSSNKSFNDTTPVPKTEEQEMEKSFITAPPSDKKTGALSIAAKIMSKMGYKQGHGLGKDDQGISEPLEIDKSGCLGLSSGKVSAGDSVQGQVDDEIKRALELARKEGTSRVLLLQNMVGPGEVDDDLESETKEECSKYGEVVKCLIYEIQNKRVPDDEAVRIFVEFVRPESAMKAASNLNGRFFGGRIVRASFYSVEKFNKYELAP